MRPAARHPSLLTLSLAAALLSACGDATLRGDGAVRVLAVPAARVGGLPASRQARLSVEPGAGPVFPPFSIELSAMEGGLGASLGGVPAGPGRRFTVEAFDGLGAVVARGSTSAEVALGADSRLVVVLNELGPADAPSLSAPRIERFTLSLDAVPVSGSVDLEVVASDASGAAVAVAWAASCGSFGTAPTSAQVTWVAPATPGTCRLAVTASDAGGISVTATVPVAVLP